MTPTETFLPRRLVRIVISNTLAFAALLSGIAARPARAQDANTIVQDMIETYHGLTSYQARANITVRQFLSNGTLVSEAGSSSLLMFQKPNRLRMDVTMPSGGHTISFDGANLLIYRNRQETYTVRPVQASVSSLKDMIPLLPDAKSVPTFDPLVLLAGNGLPSNLSDFVRKPDETRNGNPVFVVGALAKSGTARIYWTFVIDKQTKMLVRLEGRTENAPFTTNLLQADGSLLKNVRVDRNFAENITDVKLNAPIDPAVFAFKPPHGTRKVSPGDNKR